MNKHSKKQTAADVTLVECGPRDCSFLEKPVSTLDKVRFTNSLAKTGLKKIDCPAFMHPRLYPATSDTETVIEGLEKRNNLIYTAFVPNEIACRRALNTKVDEIIAMVAASEAFNQVALRQGIREMLNKTLPAIFEAASKSGKSIRAKIATAFGCPYSGKVSHEEICKLVLWLAKMGVSEICLIDNTGMSNPLQVREIVSLVMEMNLDVDLAVHFHNNRGTALANCVAAYEAGVRVFDTAVGGLGGFPFGTPGVDYSSWNVPTEDLVHLFEAMNINTGVDLDGLLECVQTAEELCGRRLNGHILRAGPSSKLTVIPKVLASN